MSFYYKGPNLTEEHFIETKAAKPPELNVKELLFIRCYKAFDYLSKAQCCHYKSNFVHFVPNQNLSSFKTI